MAQHAGKPVSLTPDTHAQAQSSGSHGAGHQAGAAAHVSPCANEQVSGPQFSTRAQGGVQRLIDNNDSGLLAHGGGAEGRGEGGGGRGREGGGPEREGWEYKNQSGTVFSS